MTALIKEDDVDLGFVAGSTSVPDETRSKAGAKTDAYVGLRTVVDVSSAWVIISLSNNLR
jgi:hypothetical protein